MNSYLGQYASIGLLLCVGIGFITGSLLLNRLLRPHVPTSAKLVSYECGVDPVGGDWAQTQLRYYIFAYLYLIFAVEAAFLFPWAVAFGSANRAVAVQLGSEMGIFVWLLALGLLYAWRKGVLRWV
ncbi:MAG: NADH-quinone oxidoreductase subunit A [Acidimicrobiales bacterium]|nr:MAG: NADH-quinone oxidoreductase subunit A [Acidimicrobiales bacterium]